MKQGKLEMQIPKVNKMKINLKSKQATAQKITIKASGKVKSAAKVAAKQPSKPAKTPAKSEPIKVSGKAIAILTGTRGVLCRLVETATQGKVTLIRALQNNIGIAEKDSAYASIANGMLTGDKLARLQLGGYVNSGACGKNGSVPVKLVTPAQFQAMSKPAIIKWQADSKPVAGRAIGDASVKGLCAVVVEYVKGNPYYWQVEADSNPVNKHERGSVTYQTGSKAKV